jgi:hypothetical protein
MVVMMVVAVVMAVVMAMIMIVVMVVVVVVAVMVTVIVVVVVMTMLLWRQVRHGYRVRTGRDDALPSCRLLLCPSAQCIQWLWGLFATLCRSIAGVGAVSIVGVVAGVGM